MGNSNKTPINQLTASFTINDDFRISGGIKDAMPKPKQWKDRVDESVWNEFHTACCLALDECNTMNYRSQYEGHNSQAKQGAAVVLLGIGGGLGLFIYWMLNSTLDIRVAVGVGTFVFIFMFGGFYIFGTEKNEANKVRRIFLDEMRKQLRWALSELNARHGGIIQWWLQNPFGNTDAKFTIVVEVSADEIGDADTHNDSTVQRMYTFSELHVQFEHANNHSMSQLWCRPPCNPKW